MQEKLGTAVIVAGMFVLPLMAQDPTVSEERVGYMGVGFSVDADTGQVLVEHVVPQAPAVRSGIRPGDLLDTVNGVEVRFKSHRDVIDFFTRSTVAGIPAAMTYVRGSKVVHVEVTPSHRPAGVAERNAKSVPCRDGELSASRRRAARGVDPKWVRPVQDDQ